MRIDHVLYATSDLDAAQSRMEAMGLRIEGGGVHDGMGTHNRIVPLGNGFLELIAVHDPELAAGVGFGRTLLARLDQDGDGLIGWAAAVDDVDATAERLGVKIIPISRQGMTARLAGVDEAAKEPYLPFFLQRKPGIADPGAGGEEGIAWLEVGGDAERLRTWLGGAELPIRVVDGPPRLLAVGIGARELRS
jgi:catechol 2,3-dioxygenase-like lactoylglutathione lyase family enzyme